MTVVTVLDEFRTPGKSVVLEVAKDGDFNARPYRLTVVRRFAKQEDAQCAYDDAVSSPSSRKPAADKQLPQNRQTPQNRRKRAATA